MRPSDYETNRFNKPVPYFSNKSNNDIIKNINEIFIFLSRYFDKKIADCLYYNDYTQLSYYIYYLKKKHLNYYNQFKQKLIDNGINYLSLQEMYEYLINQ